MGRLLEIRNAIAECFASNSQPLRKAQVFAWIGANYPQANFNLNTLQAQLYRSTVQSTAKTSAPKILWYDKTSKTYRRLLESDEVGVTSEISKTPESGDSDEEDGYEQINSTFALEAHLRDYLAKNLTILEKGLCLWSTAPPSVEFSLDGRRIDILAKDVSGVPVVVELKLNRGHEKVIGQALLYRGLLKRNLGVQKVRLILVASEITEELQTASSEISDVELYEYALTMQLNRIAVGTAEIGAKNGSIG